MMKMKRLKMTKEKLMLLMIAFLLIGCVEDFIGEGGEDPCKDTLAPTAELPDLFLRYRGEMTLVEEPMDLRVFVISSDAESNHFGSLFVQAPASAGAHGLEILLDMQDSHLQYPPGTELLLKAKGLYLDKRKEGFILGTAMPVFGNLSVGRIPSRNAPDFLLPRCGDVEPLQPRDVTLGELEDTWINTLVQLNEVQFELGGSGETFATPTEDRVHHVEDCQEGQVKIRVSQYADFRDEVLPSGNGWVRGVLRREGAGFLMHPSLRADMNLTGERCTQLTDDSEADTNPPVGEDHENETPTLLISEIADPDNAPEGRFIELYNPGPGEVDLEGWKLVRYTNANTDPGHEIALAGSLASGQVLVIAAEAEGFLNTFGFEAGLVGGSTSAAGSNGDDNMVLLGPEGKVVDIFGRVGEDGSSTDHEFEDGRAYRHASVVQGNPVFTPGEWEIYNDTGESGTTKAVQNAPEDFTPGLR